MSVIRLRTVTKAETRYLSMRLTSPGRLRAATARPRPPEGREGNSVREGVVYGPSYR